MLKILRKKGVSKKVLWFVAIIITLSFGVFGSATIMNRLGTPAGAGRIFGKNISLQDFEKSLLHTQIQAKLRYGESYDKIHPYLDLDSETWDRLILLYEAQKRRLKVSDLEVVDTVENYPLFRTKDQFDPQFYQRIVHYIFRCDPREFEEGVRESLLFEKIYNEETATVTISDQETEEAYRKRNEKIKVSYIFFVAENFKKDATAQPEEIQKYYDEHKEEFRQPLSVNLEFFALPFPKDADDKAKAAVAAKADEIYKDLQADPDMGKAAAKNNLTIGESGFYSMEMTTPTTTLPLETMKKGFELTKDTISTPVEALDGFYFLKLKEKKESYLPDFAEAGESVKDALLLHKARDIVKQKAADAVKAIKDQLTATPDGKFADIATTLGFQAVAMNPFARGEYLPAIGLSKEFQEAAFSLTEKNKISDAVELAKGFAILHLDQPPDIDKEKFAKEKDAFAKKVLLAKRGEAFTNFVARLRTKANLLDNIAKFKKQNQAAQ